MVRDLILVRITPSFFTEELLRTKHRNIYILMCVEVVCPAMHRFVTAASFSYVSSFCFVNLCLLSYVEVMVLMLPRYFSLTPVEAFVSARCTHTYVLSIVATCGW